MILRRTGFRICAKRFHRRYRGQPALLSRHCRGANTNPNPDPKTFDVKAFRRYLLCLMFVSVPKGSLLFDPAVEVKARGKG